jgi:HK97 gp10 family phage protein
MATFKTQGLDKYVAQLERLGKKTDTVISEAVYEMAKVVADEVKANLIALPSVPDTEGLKAFASEPQQKIPITKAQKWGLVHSFGIASLRNEGGFIHVKIGFDGYNEVQTKTFPKGQPNALIARSIESGSSTREKTPFLRPALAAARKQAIEAARVKFDEAIHDTFE